MQTTDYDFDFPSPVYRYKKSFEEMINKRSLSSKLPETQETPRDLDYFVKKNKEYRENMSRFNVKVENVDINDGQDKCINLKIRRDNLYLSSCSLN